MTELLREMYVPKICFHLIHGPRAVLAVSGLVMTIKVGEGYK